MRVHEILRQYNIGLSTLNEYLEMVGLDTVEINTKLDEKDSNLVAKLLNSKNLKNYEEVVKEMNNKISLTKTELRKELFDEMPPFEEMGIMQRKYYFKAIRSNFWRTIYKYPMLRSENYSDELFGNIYNLYVSGKLKELDEQRIEEIGKEIEENIQYKVYPIHDRYDVDEESMIMSALRHGDGDLFGY